MSEVRSNLDLPSLIRILFVWGKEINARSCLNLKCKERFFVLDKFFPMRGVVGCDAARQKCTTRSMEENDNRVIRMIGTVRWDQSRRTLAAFSAVKVTLTLQPSQLLRKRQKPESCLGWLLGMKTMVYLVSVSQSRHRHRWSRRQYNCQK